ncbi:hypothetical protein Lalb_Chr05g0222861 [Lupinus albus]|uniref:Uncharacterized protein n=1 Tax=Lupinus albus TaxID=3870 RepID=A0A6A4QJY8_LUPAL|nr:hypothetical protein Lalb_Chr05g0222861 [Lupinus albus]
MMNLHALPFDGLSSSYCYLKLCKVFWKNFLVLQKEVLMSIVDMNMMMKMIVMVPV